MWYVVRCFEGDDNDQTSRSWNIEAESKEDLLAIMEAEFFRQGTGMSIKRDDVTVEGDDSSLMFMWWDGDIPYHEDYFIEGEYSSWEEANKETPRW